MSRKNAKNGKLLLVTDDGENLRADLADGGGLRPLEGLGSALDAVLNVGRKAGAAAVLFLRLPETPESEVRLESGMDAAAQKLAVENAALLAAGGENPAPGAARFSWLAALPTDARAADGGTRMDAQVTQFPGAVVDMLADAAKSAGLGFAGVANLKHWLLAGHFAADGQENAFLFLHQNHGLLAARTDGRLMARYLPFGRPAAGEENEWRERARRRLTFLRGRRVSLYAADAGALPELVAAAAEAAGVDAGAWDGNAHRRAAAAFLTARADDAPEFLVPAQVPPVERDAGAKGTLIGILLMVLAAAWVAGQGIRNTRTIKKITGGLAAAREDDRKVREAQTRHAAAVKDERQARTIYRLYTQRERLSPQFMTALNLLSRYRMLFSRVTDIREQADGFYFSGETVWQPDLSRFFTHFERVLDGKGMTLVSDNLEKKEERRLIFRAHAAWEKKHE